MQRKTRRVLSSLLIALMIVSLITVFMLTSSAALIEPTVSTGNDSVLETSVPLFSESPFPSAPVDTLPDFPVFDPTDPVPSETESTSDETNPTPGMTDPTPSVTDPGESAPTPTESDPTPGESDPTPTETDPTPTETDPVPSVTEPTKPSNIYIMGDVDLDGKVSVKDATMVQKKIALLVELSNIQKLLANCDHVGGINVKDATLIQKYVAKIYVPGSTVGNMFRL